MLKWIRHRDGICKREKRKRSKESNRKRSSRKRSMSGKVFQNP